MAGQDLMSAGFSPQTSSLQDSGAYPSSNGFDFGMSQPKTGLGYGLLGDLQTLKANMGGQTCDDCPPGAPCPSCQEQDSQPALAGDPGQIIKAQFPMPLPGLIPPPPIGLLPPSPSQPAQPPIIGDPNAWWNRPLDDLFSWAGRPTEEQREKCEDQYETDLIDCKTVYAVKGTRQGKACEERAWDRRQDCLYNDGQKDIPPYWRQGS